MFKDGSNGKKPGGGPFALLTLRLQSRGLHAGTQIRRAAPAASASPFLALHGGEARRVVPQASRATALQLQVLEEAPWWWKSFPGGRSITPQDSVPAHPVLCGPPRHCHLAALQSSLTGGCGPFPEESCPPSAFGAKRVRFHPSSL